MIKIVKINPKVLVLKLITSIYDIKPRELQAQLHISNSYVSKYLSGERNCLELDIFIIEKVFGIKVKDFIVNE